jgi:Na+/H+ antiporter NhaC
MLYPLAAAVLVGLFATGVLPHFGSMKKAFQIARETGNVFSGESDFKFEDQIPEEGVKPNIFDFLLPMAVLLIVTIVTGPDLLKGTVSALAVCLLLYIPRKKMTLKVAVGTFVEGFQSMVLLSMAIVCAFVLNDINQIMGLSDFIIDHTLPYLDGIWFPAIVFGIHAIIGFCTASNWATWAILMPILLPLGDAIGVPVSLTLGAMISGGAFGSHACPWGDATILASAGAGVDNIEHVRTQIVYCFVGAGISLVGFVVLAAIMV